MKLKALGKSGAKYEGLETFATPRHLAHVCCISDEVTAVCPVTGQPDWYVVEIEYQPRHRCVESKSLKLFLQSYRNTGEFCEALASDIAQKFHAQVEPDWVHVQITQKPRGGVKIIAKAYLYGKASKKK